MALEAWADENNNLYVSGRNPEDYALLDDGSQVIETANNALKEWDYEGVEVTADTLTDFQTLWVDPEVYQEEVWPTLAFTYDADTGREQGWKPVLRIDIEEI